MDLKKNHEVIWDQFSKFETRGCFHLFLVSVVFKLRLWKFISHCNRLKNGVEEYFWQIFIIQKQIFFQIKAFLHIYHVVQKDVEELFMKIEQG